MSLGSATANTASAVRRLSARMRARGLRNGRLGPGRAQREIYGFGQADAIADFNQNNPDWYNTVRPSRLPKYENEFGQDGHFYLSTRKNHLSERPADSDRQTVT